MSYIYINSVPVIYRNYLFLAPGLALEEPPPLALGLKVTLEGALSDGIFHKRIGTSRGVEPEIPSGKLT